MRKMIMTLSVVTLLSGVVLATAYTLFLPSIEANRQAALERSLSALFESAESPSFESVDSADVQIYRGTNAQDELIGYAVRVITTGYGGEIQLLVGLSPGLKEIVGMEVVEHLETPGLGAKITASSFQQQFEGLNPAEDLSFVKNEEPDTEENEIQAISGATISTRAVVNGINDDVGTALEALQSEEGKE